LQYLSRNTTLNAKSEEKFICDAVLLVSTSQDYLKATDKKVEKTKKVINPNKKGKPLTINGKGIFRVGEGVGLQLPQPLRGCRINVVRMGGKTKG
jgi:hypothetical protein